MGGGAEPETPADKVPDGWIVRDIGEATNALFEKALRRCRGVVWNGTLGVWEEERWQRGTRSFLAAVEQRFEAGGEEEEDEEAEDEDDEDGDAKAAKDEEEPEADFEVAVVIG